MLVSWRETHQDGHLQNLLLVVVNMLKGNIIAIKNRLGYSLDSYQKMFSLGYFTSHQKVCSFLIRRIPARSPINTSGERL